MKRLIVLVASILEATVSVQAAEKDSPTEVPTAEFTHILDSNKQYSSNLVLQNDEAFSVVIKDTCPDQFAVKINGIESAPVKNFKALQAGQSCTADMPITVTAKHDSKNGAYEVLIERIDGKPGGVDASQGGNTGKLYPARYLIIVPANKWSTIFSGGIGFSSLTSEKYSLSADAAGTSFTVVRNKSSEDKANAIAAAFVTVTNEKWVTKGGTRWGPSFGVGTNTGSKIQYFPGFSILFGQYVLTFGANIGSVDTLPSGLKEGSTTKEANALNTSGTKTGVGGFISISLSFLGSDAQNQIRRSIVPAEGT